MSDLSKAFLSIENPIVKGHISEFIAQIYFAVKGWHAYKPTGESGRVDYVAEINGDYLKIQVKTVFMEEGKFKVSLSKKGKNKKLLLYSQDDLDLLVAYSPRHNAIIEVPGHLVWGKHTITFSSKSDGNYCGTSRFIEDYITLRL